MAERPPAIVSSPIVVITGCLGAGKTTLLNHLLGLNEISGLKPVIIVNEFGPLGIDGRLIQDGPFKKYELNNGSVFCECLRPQLMAVLADAAKLSPKLILVEAAGVADPADLETIIGSPGLAGKFRIHSEICVVDAINFVKMAAFMAIVRRQAASADALVINKTDLTGRDEVSRLEKILKDMNPSAGMIAISHGRLDWGFVSGQTHRQRGRELPQIPPASITAVAINTDRPMSWLAFQNAVAEFGERMLRLKGLADFGQGGEFVEIAGQDLTRRPAEEAVKNIRGITVIVWKATADEIKAAFERAFVSDYPQED